MSPPVGFLFLSSVAIDSALGQFSQDIVQNSPVTVVLDFDWCVDPALRLEYDLLAIFPSRRDGQFLQRLDLVIDGNAKRFGPVETQ